MLRTHGVVRLLGSNSGAPVPVNSNEIVALQMLVKSGKDFDVFNHLKEGSNVRITRGALQGIEGILTKKKTSNQYSFAINIEILGRSVCVAIQPDELELT